MRFRLTPRLMTLDDPDLEFLRNIAGFRSFGSQQRLNELR